MCVCVCVVFVIVSLSLSLCIYIYTLLMTQVLHRVIVMYIHCLTVVPSVLVYRVMQDFHHQRYFINCTHLFILLGTQIKGLKWGPQSRELSTYGRNIMKDTYLGYCFPTRFLLYSWGSLLGGPRSITFTPVGNGPSTSDAPHPRYPRCCQGPSCAGWGR